MNRTTLLTLFLSALWPFPAFFMRREIVWNHHSLFVHCTAVAWLLLFLYAYASGEQQVSVVRKWMKLGLAMTVFTCSRIDSRAHFGHVIRPYLIKQASNHKTVKTAWGRTNISQGYTKFGND